MPASEKRSLRRHYRAVRRTLSLDSQQRHALVVADAVSRRLADDATVAAYLARDGEVDLGILIEKCWQRGIPIAVPVLRGRDGLRRVPP